MTLEDIPAGQVRDYLMASAACFPALRARQIDGVKFLDGGYSDNMPTGLAKTMGAEELVCVDLEGVGITRPNLTGLPTTMIRSYWELGDILHFDTTRTLAQAFLAACDKDRMESFAPLFTGSSTAGQAALAALLPNTFLQALVWRTLTASALPEVTEDEGL